MTPAECTPGRVVRYHGALAIISSWPFSAFTPATIAHWGTEPYVRLVLERGLAPAKCSELVAVDAHEVARALGWR